MFESIYWVEPSVELELVIFIIKKLIPCFISLDDFDGHFSSLWIECRAEDAAFVENMLAPFV